MSATARGVLIVAFAIAVATVFLGWWTVPVVGLGWAWQRGAERPALEAAGGAGLGWAALLGLAAAQGDLGLVARRVGGVLDLSAAGFVTVTLLFAMMLAGSAAAVGREVRAAVARRRLPSPSSAVRLGLALALATAGPALHTPRPLRAQSLDSAIRAEVARYVEAVNRGDARGVAELYARTAGTTSAGDGEVTRGWTDIRALLGSLQAALGQITMTVDSITVAPVGDRGAVAVFLYAWTGRVEADSFRTQGAMTLVYQRTAEGWRVVHDHTSTRGEGGRGDPMGPEGAFPPSTSPVPLSRPISETEPCTVERIADGDTLACRGGMRVRLIGIDAPEMSQGPFGEEARVVLARLVPVGSSVLLERDVELEDQHGRRLAYVWRDGVFVNWQMVRGGWAVLLTFPPNVQYVEYFEDAQRKARAGRTGLWAREGFECLPADRRRGRC